VNDFQLTPTRFWLSSYSDSNYPIGWDLRIPKLGLELTVLTPVKNQELQLDFVYWEGLIRVQGTKNGRPVSGVGYLELTGYQRGTAGKAGGF
ncbi:MAG: lipocalin family protein, partial [Verrucomicrobia bacterium]|nr:lipocalin family protein [Verrucomicrobiota bacterium]